MLAPVARLAVEVEVVEQHDERDNHRHDAAHADQPPCPPERLPSLEESNRLLAERLHRLKITLILLVGVRHRGVGRIVDANALTQGRWRVEDGDSKAETHDEATDMGEVVKSRQETENEGDADIERDEKEFLPGRDALLPVVEKIQECQGDETED